MPRLLIVHHTPSPSMQAMFEAVVSGTAAGLKWRRARPPVCATGEPSRADLDACWELGATLAAELAGPG